MTETFHKNFNETDIEGRHVKKIMCYNLMKKYNFYDTESFNYSDVNTRSLK